MIAFTNRRLGFGLAAALLAGLAGCTSIEEAARIDPKSLPPASQAATGTPAVAAAAQPAPGMPITPTGPVTINDTTVASIPVPIPKGGPTIENAQALNPAAPTIANAQAANPAAPTIANAMAANAATPAAQAVQSVSNTAAPQLAAAPAPVSATAAGAEILPAEMAVVQSVVPTPKPAALAYAATPAVASLAMIDNQFDTSAPAAPVAPQPKAATSGPSAINSLISKYAVLYDLPESLVHRVVHRESRYDPAAFNGGHYGLMQIKYATARSMGFDGPAKGLFDAENNLKYAIKYLRGAYLVADRNPDGAVRLYARGYYYDAKRKGMLHVLK